MDENPKVENVDAPAGSQPEIQTPDEGSQVQPQQGAEGLGAEEATWNNLKGSTQERIKQLARQVNEERQRAEQLETDLRRSQFGGGVPMPDFNNPALVNPEVKEAVKKLDEFGVATKDYVGQQIDNTVNQRLAGLVYNIELDRLETRHNGSDGLPAFNKEEYEAFTGKYPQYRNYAPEDVYEKMYKGDILEAQIAQSRGQVTQSNAPVLRPSKTRVQDEPLTADLVEQKLQSLPQAERIQWYERNLDKINAVVAQATQNPSES